MLLGRPLPHRAPVRTSGAPRLRPLSPSLADGRLFVAIPSTSPRRFDLARDGSYSLHTLPPELGPDYDEFEFNLTGTASRITDAATLVLIDEAEAARARPAIPRNDWLEPVGALQLAYLAAMARGDIDEDFTAIHPGNDTITPGTELTIFRLR